MLNEHSKLGIAQIVFYVPIVFLSIYVKHRNDKRPPMAWVPLIIFSLVRLIGGILMILLENSPNSIGLTIATLILLDFGVVPLAVSSLGFLQMILATDFEPQHTLELSIKVSKVGFVAVAALLVAGASIIGNQKSESSVSIGYKLVRAGYIVFVVLFALIVDLQSHFWSWTSRLSRNSITILKAMACTIPFFIVRNVYSLIAAFSSMPGSRWNSLYGSAAVLACMALLMEYFVMAIYLYIGFNLSPVSPRQPNLDGNNGPKATSFGSADQDSGIAEREYE